MARKMNQWQLKRQMKQNLMSNNQAILFELPKEVRTMIYEYLDQETRLKLRSICKQFKIDVEQHTQFAIEFHQDNPVMQWQSGLRIHDCKIVIPTDASKAGLINNLQLGQPGAVRRFHIQHPVLRKGECLTSYLCPDIYTSMLPGCSGVIKELSVTLDGSVFCHRFDFGIAYQFLHLKDLEVIVNIPEYLTVHDQEHPSTKLFKQLVQLSFTPKLQIIRIHLNMKCAPQLQHQMRYAALRLLCKTWKNLISLDISFTITKRYKSLKLVDVLSLEDLANLNKLDGLTDLKLQNVSLHNDEGCWKKILLNQRKLKSLELKVNEYRPVKYLMLCEIVNQNVETLTSICVGYLESGYELISPIVVPLDFSVFSNCVNLKTVSLTLCYIYKRLGCADVINLHKMPTNLEYLALKYFQVKTGELMKFGKTPNSLRELKLEYAGTCGMVGVTGTLINHLLTTMDNLQHIHVTPQLNVSLPTEIHVIDDLLSKYKMETLNSEDPTNIDLVRDAKTAWRRSEFGIWKD